MDLTLISNNPYGFLLVHVERWWSKMVPMISVFLGSIILASNRDFWMMMMVKDDFFFLYCVCWQSPFLAWFGDASLFHHFKSNLVLGASSSILLNISINILINCQTVPQTKNLITTLIRFWVLWIRRFVFCHTHITSKACGCLDSVILWCI